MASVENEYRRKRRRVLVGGGVAAALLYVGGAAVFDTQIENDLETRVPEALADEGIDGVTAKFSGQNGTLTCDTPLADPTEAEQIALNVRGVYKIDLDDCRTNTTTATTVPDTTPETTAPPTTSAPSTTVEDATPTTAPAGEYDSVAEIVSNDPGYAKFAIRMNTTDSKNELSDSAAGPFTVFAPSTDAFGELSATELAVLDSDTAKSDALVQYHVVQGEIALDDLTDGAELTTMSGETLVVAGDGEDATIEGASITGPPIAAKNGLVYTIDKVLVPENLDLTASEEPAAAAATFDAGAITLSGTVGSEAERSTLVTAATDAVGDGNVTDKLTVDSAAPLGDNTEDLATLIGGMQENLVSGEAGYDGTSLYVTGKYATDADKTAMTDLAESVSATATLEARPDADAGSAADLETQLNEYVAANPILFESGSATITAESADVISKIAGMAQQVGGLNIVIQGHTDSDGTAADNKRLSTRRAEAVLAALVEAGVDEDTLTAEGFGDEEPVLVNGTEDKAASRRVVFELTASN